MSRTLLFLLSIFQLSDEAQELQDFSDETAKKLQHFMKRLEKRKRKLTKSGHRQLVVGSGDPIKDLQWVQQAMMVGSTLAGNLAALGALVLPMAMG